MRLLVSWMWVLACLLARLLGLWVGGLQVTCSCLRASLLSLVDVST
jgi:hypothetical protein